jgi:hypothetical protein
MFFLAYLHVVKIFPFIKNMRLRDSAIYKYQVTMSDAENIAYTALATISGGLLLYILGELISKRSIEPCINLKSEISRVKFTLSYFAPIINTPISRTTERSEEAAKALRERSAELLSLVELVPENRVLRFLSFSSLPPDKDVIEAAIQLRAIATYLYDTGEKALNDLEVIKKRIGKIENLLKFRVEINT